MALPTILRRLFDNDGYGPELREAILPYITATGSTFPRRIKDRFADLTNVKDFGAAGDGTTSDAAAFTAAASGGNPVFVPKGTYNVPSTVDGLFYGFGSGTKIVGSDTKFYDLLQGYVDTVYVDASHNNSNTAYDGLTEETAFGTIAEAYNYVKPRNNLVNIVIAGGTYDEELIFNDINIIISITGNVVITGHVYLQRYCTLSIAQIGNPATPTYSLTVGGIHASWSAISVGVNLTVNSASSSQTGISVQDSSRCLLSNNLTITGTFSFYLLFVERNSSFDIVGNASFTGTAPSSIVVDNSSYAHFEGTVASSVTTSGTCILTQDNSNIEFSSSVSVSNAQGTIMSCGVSSDITVAGLLTGHLKASKNGITAGSRSRVALNGGLSITVASGTANYAVYATGHSMVEVSSSLSVTGAFSTVVYISRSYFSLSSTATVTNNATGRRYYALYFSGIHINGHSAGVNRIPGNTAGSPSAAASSYSSYIV